MKDSQNQAEVPAPPTPAELASTAGEAIRSLAHATHATQAAKGELQYFDDACTVVVNLKQMAASLPQCADQLGRFLSEMAAADSLSSVQGDLSWRLTEALAGLNDAARAARTLHWALDRAHNGLSPIVRKN